MNSHPIGDLIELRERAVSQLVACVRPDIKRGGASEAMAVLLKLASSPATAGEALALLHELQVHQVELDLQNEELSRSRMEIEEALARLEVQMDHAPVGHLSIDADTVARACNATSERLLDVERGELLGRPLNGFLSTASQKDLHALMSRAREGCLPETQALQGRDGLSVARVLHAAVCLDALPGRFQVVLMRPPARPSTS